MPLPGSNQPLPRGGVPARPTPSSAPEVLKNSRPITSRPNFSRAKSSATPKDASFLGGGQGALTRGIREKWTGGSREIAPGRILSQSDRLSFLKRMESKYGTHIQPLEFDDFIKKLDLEKTGKSAQERARIDQDIKWLKREFKGPGK